MDGQIGRVEGLVMSMGETANRLEDVEKQISVDDTALEEARKRRREVLALCATFAPVSKPRSTDSLS